MVGARMLLEREDVTAAAARLLDVVESGGSGALFVLGEAGLGKTSLVERVCDLADGRVRVGLGRGHPMDTGLAFGLAAQVLDSVEGYDVLAADEAVPSGETRTTRLYGALRWLAQPAKQPLLLVLDNLHWADPDSLVLVSFLCRRLARLQVGLIVTMRTWPSAAYDVAMELKHDGYGEVAWLAPLSQAAAGVLLSERTDRALPGEVVKRAWRACGGNPLLLEQVAVAINQGEDVPEPLADGSPIPPVEIVLSRFAGLSAAGLRCAEAAAVLGQSFLPGLAVEIAQLTEGEVDAALDAMSRSGLVRTAPDGGTEFVHPLFAQALYRNLSGPLRTRLHARAFAALVSRGREAEAAEHAVQAELFGDPAAVGVLERVGLAARRVGAVASAADRLQAAARLAGDRAEPGLLLATGETLLDSGRPAEAIAAYERLLAHPDCPTPVRIKALRLLGRTLAFTGAYERAEARLRDAGLLAEASDPATAVEVLLDHAMIFWFGTGPRAALPLITRAHKIAAGVPGGPHRGVQAAWTNIALQRGDPADPEELSETIEWLRTALDADVTELGGMFGIVQNTALTAIFVEQFAEAERLLITGRDIAERRGAIEAVVILGILHGRALFQIGRLKEAMEIIEVMLGYTDVFPMLGFHSGVGTAYVSHYLGRLEHSADWCDRVEALAPGQDLVLLFVQELRAQRYLRDGWLEQASEAYLRIEETIHRIGIGEPCVLRWARHAVTAHVGCGRMADAERVVDWLAEHSAVLPCRWPRIALATSRATLADDGGDHPRADGYFREALALHDEVELAVEKIETLLEYGSFLRRSGQLTRARPVLTQALDLVESTGARWYAAPIREELRLAGGRRRRPRENPDQLTAAESRVARLVATGRSNRQVAAALSLSVHTVEGHLDRIYAKLGIHSRGELIAQTAQSAGQAPGPEPAKE
ncbi:MAG: AAA family ATPase [Pseudonocardia sp.]